MPQCAGKDMGGRCPAKALENDVYCKRHRQEAGPEKKVKRDNPAIGEALAAKGQELAAAKDDNWVAIAVPIIRQLAHQHGRTNSDELYYYCQEKGLPWATSPGAPGAAFKKSGLVPTDERIKSRRPSRHSNTICWWSLP